MFWKRKTSVLCSLKSLRFQIINLCSTGVHNVKQVFIRFYLTRICVITWKHLLNKQTLFSKQVQNLSASPDSSAWTKKIDLWFRKSTQGFFLRTVSLWKFWNIKIYLQISVASSKIVLWDVQEELDRSGWNSAKFLNIIITIFWQNISSIVQRVFRSHHAHSDGQSSIGDFPIRENALKSSTLFVLRTKTSWLETQFCPEWLHFWFQSSILQVILVSIQLQFIRW